MKRSGGKREDQKEANLDVALKFNALLQKVMEKAPDAEYLAVSAAVMVWIVKGGAGGDRL